MPEHGGKRGLSGAEGIFGRISIMRTVLAAAGMFTGADARFLQ